MKRASYICAAASGLLAAMPAAATVQVCEGNNCTATDENVLVNAATNVTTVTGSTQSSGFAVEFTSATDMLDATANGQAKVSASDGLLNSLTFSIVGGTFTSAVFNLNPLPGNQANEATSITLQYYDPALGTYGTRTIDTNGQNFLGVYGDAGEQFTAITFSGNPLTTGISDLRQLRLGGITASVGSVPEPGAWAMMLSGFGLMGAMMRRRRADLSVA